MNTSKLLAELYSIIEKEFGRVEAKESVSTAVYLVICDIHESGDKVTPELIEEKLEIYVRDFREVVEAKKNSVA